MVVARTAAAAAAAAGERALRVCNIAQVFVRDVDAAAVGIHFICAHICCCVVVNEAIDASQTRRGGARRQMDTRGEARQGGVVVGVAEGDVGGGDVGGIW